MRQRKIKNLDEKLAALSDYIIDDAESMKGRWRSLFNGSSMSQSESSGEENDGAPAGRLFVEFGCGKGKFIQGMALLHPENMYVAFEGNQSVVYHAIQKAEEAGLANVRFIPHYIDSAADYFDAGEIDGIYLNFSDPWPKSKHEKRRLTAGTRLDDYVKAVRSGGTVEFRTDNDDLFDYTMEKIMMTEGIKIVAVTRDLHAELKTVSDRIDYTELTDAGFEDGVDEELTTFQDLSVTSEYEDKFSGLGKNINYVRLKVL